MEVIKKFIGSRKFWIAMGSIFIPIIAVKINWMTPDEIEKLYYSLLALLLGQSLSDFGKGNK